MKELTARQYSPQSGQINIYLRVIGKLIFLKVQNNPQANQMIEKLRQNGADIELSANGWAKIDMFKNNSLVRIGGKEFDAQTLPEEMIEDILFDFYKEQYKRAHFEVEEKI